MGIYIKDMKMPKSCAFCRFNGSYCYAKGDEDTQSTLSCPLVSIQSHGKLIDADEFLKRAIGTKCFSEDYALMLEELVGESIIVIPVEEE